MSTHFQDIAAKVEAKLVEASKNGTFMTKCAMDAMVKGDNATATACELFFGAERLVGGSKGA